MTIAEILTNKKALTDMMDRFNEDPDDTAVEMIERMEAAASSYTSVRDWAAVYFNESSQERINAASRFAGNLRFDEFSAEQENEIDQLWAESMATNVQLLIESKLSGVAVVGGESVDIETI